MSPLIGIALTLLPELAKRLTRNGKPETQKAVINAVTSVLGTSDPKEAQSRMGQPDLSNALRLRLAEIENDEAAAEMAERELARQAELDRLRLEVAEAINGRENSRDARALLSSLNRDESVIAWGPVVVSAVVVTGFFATLLYLINGGLSPERLSANDPSTQLVFQIVNIAVGTLTAGFATVISFWLGSSDGSRRKDLSLAQAQQAQQETQRNTTRQASELVKEQTRQTRDILRQITPPRGARTAPAPLPATLSRFGDCVEIILGHEGGYVDHPKDPGGATNLGITHITLAEWRGNPVSKADMRTLKRAEAEEIYRARYWNALNCDHLPAGVDLVVFDFGVNAGPARAARLLQRILGVSTDGQIGPQTIAAAGQADAQMVISAFSDGRMQHYRGLKHWPSFGRGWSRRTQETRKAALAMSSTKMAA
ncbi:MAG: glycoside hydrolase family 108 protein [Mangrovicoccus sp.]|nr:glycoside hydrolase family 108 protein [Mangrovicoccus sp.]